MKHLKKSLFLLATALMLLSLAGCGGKNADLIDLGDSTLHYKSAYVVTDTTGMEEQEILVVTFDFTNNTGDPISYVGWVEEAAAQNGEALEHTSVFLDSDASKQTSDTQLDAVASGATVEVSTAFVLRDGTTPIELALSRTDGTEGGRLTIDPTPLDRVRLSLTGVG